MSFRRFQKADKEHTRKHRPQVSDSEDWHGAESTAPLSPNSVIQLQRTIGNRAVQQLIQRDSGGAKQAEVPPVLASITLDKRGKLKGSSRVEGHEGKIEVLSLNRDVKKPTRDPDDPSPNRLSIMRNVDELSNQFARANTEGDPIKAAQFEFVRRNEEGKVETLHSLEFGEGFISGYSISGGEQSVEQIEMEFKGNS